MAWEREEAKPVVVSEKPRIALLLPHRESLPAEFVESIWGPLRNVPVAWCEKIPRMCRTPSLPVARNMLAQQALDAGATHLLWVDSDGAMETPQDPNEALRLLYGCDAPIAACLYRSKQKTGFNYAAWNRVKDGYTPIESWTGNWFPVDVTGLHFVLIKREVFEKVPKPWFHWETESPSEDFYFFERAREAGYPVRIFAEVKLSHLGDLKVLSSGKVTTRDV
jgi:hypothetical protein